MPGRGLRELRRQRPQRGGVHSAGRNSLGDAGPQICSSEWMGDVETGREIGIPQCAASRGALGGSASLHEHGSVWELSRQVSYGR